MDAISQTTFWATFSWMKIFEFRLKFHWSLLLRVQLAIFQHWLRWWLGAVQATSHYLNQWSLVYRRIYASLGFNELTNSTTQNFCARDVIQIPVRSCVIWRHRSWFRKWLVVWRHRAKRMLTKHQRGFVVAFTSWWRHQMETFSA